MANQLTYDKAKCHGFLRRWVEVEPVALMEGMRPKQIQAFAAAIRASEEQSKLALSQRAAEMAEELVRDKGERLRAAMVEIVKGAEVMLSSFNASGLHGDCQHDYIPANNDGNAVCRWCGEVEP